MPKSHQPTPDTRRQVTQLALCFLPQQQIATIMGIDVTTLRRHYRDELSRGAAQADLTVGRSLFDQINGRPAEYDADRNLVREELKPDRSVIIFASKSRLEMKDTQWIKMDLTAEFDFSRLSTPELETLETLLGKAKRTPANDDGPAASGAGGTGKAEPVRRAGRRGRPAGSKRASR